MKRPRPAPRTRRAFLRTAGAALAVSAAPLILPSRLLGAGAPSRRLRVGQVGCGRVEIGLPTDPTAPDNPPQPVPAHLDYEQWLGPTPEVYYTEQRVHSQQRNARGELDIGARPGWLRNEAFCLGMITGWGSHHFDTALWGMDMERVAPLRLEGRGEFPPPERIWNVHGAYHVELAYPGGVTMTVTDRFPNGIRFIGDEGWIFVSRSRQTWNGQPPEGVVGDFVQSRARPAAAAAAASFKQDGEPAGGIAILSHSDNSGERAPWYLIDAGAMRFMCAAVLAPAVRRLAPGERWALRYRVVVQPGEWTPEALTAAWRAWETAEAQR